MHTLHEDYPPELVGRLDTAEKIAPLMTTATGILGNPRLIKRFLNALSIRMAISKAQGVGVDEAVLAKMLLFGLPPKTWSSLNGNRTTGREPGSDPCENDPDRTRSPRSSARSRPTSTPA